MFSLLITIIAIALVAALALATLYYGGDIFNQGADRAQAAKIAAQGQQVMGAMELYHAEKGVYPNTLADLVTDEYLKSIPVAFAPEVQAIQSALAAGVTWTLAAPGQPVIALTPVTLATCQAYNASQFGVSKVLRAPHEAQLKSCYGSDLSNLTIIQAKSASDLVFVSTDVSAPLQIGPVVATPLPAAASTDTSIDGWLVPGAAGAPAVAYLDAFGAPLNGLTFPDTPVFESSAKTVQLKNTGTADLVFTPGMTQLSAPFAFNSDGCDGVTLAPTESCYVSISVTPQAAGLISGPTYTYAPAANIAVTPLLLSVTGTQTIWDLSAVDLQLDFPSVPTGSNNSLTVYPFNMSVTDSSIVTVDIQPFTGSAFTVSNGCASPVAPASPCAITVTFAPSAGKVNSALMTLTPADGSAVLQVPLTGQDAFFSDNFSGSTPQIGLASSRSVDGLTGHIGGEVSQGSLLSDNVTVEAEWVLTNSQAVSTRVLQLSARKLDSYDEYVVQLFLYQDGSTMAMIGDQNYGSAQMISVSRTDGSHLVKLVVTGDTHSLYYDGVMVFQVTEPSNSFPGQNYISFSSGAQGQQVVNFQGRYQ